MLTLAATMLLSHLLAALGGITSLVAAFPTPVNFNARAQGLVVYVEDGYDSPGFPINAIHRCFKFVKTVYRNVHAYHVTDLVCNFMGSDRCSGKAVLVTDARGRVSENEWGCFVRRS
jgi:hypothetical protein